MHVADADALFVQVLGKVLGHALGQGRDQRAVALPGYLPHLVQQVVHLGLDGADLDHRVQQAGGADHLLGEDAAGLVQFPLAGSGRHENRLRAHRIPFLELEGPVVHAGRQAEAELGQRELAPEVAAIHAADLRHADVAFVGKDDGVVGDELEQRRRRLARRTPGQVAAVVLDAVADARGLEHLDVEVRPLFQPLGFQQLALVGQLLQSRLKFGPYPLDRLLQCRPRRDVVAVGVDADLLVIALACAGQGVELDNRLKLVSEEAEPPSAVLQVGGPDLDHVAAHPEGTPLEGRVQPLVLLRHQLVDEVPLVVALAHDHVLRHGRIGLDRADAVDAGHRGHDDHVIAFQKRAGRRVAHPVDGLVDLRFLLDIGVAARNVGLGLVVVVVADEVFHRVVGEEALELAVQLRSQRLVRGKDDRRALGFLDHLGHGVGLAGARRAQQHLVTLSVQDTLGKLGDGRGLVAGRGKLALHHEALAAFQLHPALWLQQHGHRGVRVVVGHGDPEGRGRGDHGRWGARPPPSRRKAALEGGPLRGAGAGVSFPVRAPRRRCGRPHCPKAATCSRPHPSG